MTLRSSNLATKSRFAVSDFLSDIGKVSKGYMQIGVKVKVYQFQKAEAANRNTQNKFLCFAVCPPVVLVLGRPVKQWSSCGIGGHAVCRLLCILVYV